MRGSRKPRGSLDPEAVVKEQQKIVLQTEIRTKLGRDPRKATTIQRSFKRRTRLMGRQEKITR